MRIVNEMCTLNEIAEHYSVGVLLPEMRFVLRHLDDTDAPSKSTIIHCATQTPLVLFRVVNFNRFQISEIKNNKIKN